MTLSVLTPSLIEGASISGASIGGGPKKKVKRKTSSKKRKGSTKKRKTSSKKRKGSTKKRKTSTKKRKGSTKKRKTSTKKRKTSSKKRKTSSKKRKGSTKKRKTSKKKKSKRVSVFGNSKEVQKQLRELHALERDVLNRRSIEKELEREQKYRNLKVASAASIKPISPNISEQDIENIEPIISSTPWEAAVSSFQEPIAYAEPTALSFQEPAALSFQEPTALSFQEPMAYAEPMASSIRTPKKPSSIRTPKKSSSIRTPKKSSSIKSSPQLKKLSTIRSPSPPPYQSPSLENITEGMKETKWTPPPPPYTADIDALEPTFVNDEDLSYRQ
jgi:hypothetical protein